MRTSIVFVMGLVLGSAIATGLAQGNRIGQIKGINHVAMSVDNFDETMAFYTQKMGFREVLTMRNDQGQPTLAFVQASRDTFLEIAPSNANRPAGLTHFGLLVDDMNATVANLKQRGLTVTEPRVVGTQWSVASVTGPSNVRIELSELGPEAPPRKATESWK
jgi:catechol 2,3-dioxygenase-like lactoylglutathione lyase family enzyme